MRNRGRGWILVAIFLLLDFYVFHVVQVLAIGAARQTQLTIYIIYWLISIATSAMVVAMPYINFEKWPKAARTYIFATMAGLFFAKLIASVFFLIDDIRRSIIWIVTKVSPSLSSKFITDNGIAHSTFLSWLGIGMGGGLFLLLVYGFSNKYNYQVRRIKLAFNNLPISFKDLKIVHISDIHSGSFNNKEAVQEGVNTILQQKPDLILFTGDLVNDRATEMADYIDIFSQLKAPLGVYSTLGNHDYGDYVHWESATAKSENLEALIRVHAKLGWRLLMNEHVAIEKNGEAIALLGIENWSSKARFPKHGRMDLAYAGTEKYPFKILMSHDPSHWDAEVKPAYPDIDLTLAGHTHGMQFGIDLPWFKWSPVQWMYKKWAGLYEEGKQKLYINRGFGFIGYPGRVGVLPEITVIELV